MCGRFTLQTSLDTLGEHFLFDIPADITLTPKWNIAPTHSIATLLWNQGKRHYGRMHWGLIPRWAKDNSRAAKMINARCETIREKPSFREPFKKQRCLILADGYYEWKPDNPSRQPVFEVPAVQAFAHHIVNQNALIVLFQKKVLTLRPLSWRCACIQAKGYLLSQI